MAKNIYRPDGPDDASVQRNAPIDWTIFWPASVIVLLVVFFMVTYQSTAQDYIQAIYDFVVHQLGFAYIWAGAFFFGMVLWLALGRYSDVRLGGPAAQPEFSRLSWIAMFFCAGIGTSLLYWASIEWTYYYISPPFGLEPESKTAADYAAMYGMFHWGPLAWAFYCVSAFAVGYAFYNRKAPQLRMSTACGGILGEQRVKGVIGKIIDVSVVVGLVGGIGTVLASGTPMLAEAVSRQLGIEHTFAIDIGVVVVWTIIFVTSVLLGLEKGIKRLSDINLMALALLSAIIFIGGPTVFMLDVLTNSTGLMLEKFARMTFYTEPIRQSMFPQNWTIFYWGWWVAMGPYMSIFIARISCGRTFRDIGLTVILAGSAGCILFFMLFGATSIYVEFNDIFPVLKTIDEVSPSAAILGTLQQLPMAWLILPLFIFVGFVYSGTTVDSSAYVLASTTSGDLSSGAEPSVWNRLFWALVLGGSGLVLMNLGGITPLKTASLVVGLPLLVVMTLSVFSLLKWLRADFPELSAASKRDPASVREHNC